MKPLLLNLFLFLLFIAPLEAAVAVVSPIYPTSTEAEIDLPDPADYTRTAVEEKLGRKLKFKERVGLALLRGKLKKARKRAAKGKAASTTGRDWMPWAALACLALSPLISFLLLGAILFSALSLKRNRYIDPPMYTLAKIVLYISLGLVILGIILIIFVVAIFASGF